MHECADRLAGPLVRAGDDLAAEFEARLADSSALAFRVAYSVVRHQQDAEDVAQEAFTGAFRRFRQLRDRDRFRAWLVRMTWRLALDHRRGHRRREARENGSLVAFAPEAHASQEDALLARERRDRLWTAIDRLPDKLRIVVILAAIDGHGIKEVASLVDAPEGTVKSRLFDARKKLQEMLR
jgi:RNA polymerase sigma-70 factor, ECF subfamily